jgi:carbonic anhydrase
MWNVARGEVSRVLKECGYRVTAIDPVEKLISAAEQAGSADAYRIAAAADLARGRESPVGNYIDWLTFTDNAKSVVEDVMRIRNHPLVPNDYIYDVKSGKLVEVPEAITAGKLS